MTNYLKKLLALAVAAGAMTLVAAPTPAAMWTNFRDLTRGDYTWVKSDHTTVDEAGVVTIGDDGALSLSFASGNAIRTGRKLTLILDVIAPSFSPKAAIVDIIQNGNNICLGSTANTLELHWGTGTRNKTHAWTADGATKQRIAISYRGVSNDGRRGTRYIVNGDAATAVYDQGLMTGTGEVTTLHIGRFVDTGIAYATGLKVCSAALFEEDLDAEVMAGFDFPPAPIASSSFDTGDLTAAASTFLGGPAIEYGQWDWSGTPVYTAVRDSATNKALTIANTARPCNEQGLGSDEAFSFLTVARLPGGNTNPKVLAMLGNNAYNSGATGLSLVWIGNTVKLLNYKTGTGTAVLASAEVPTLAAQYHSFLVTYSTTAGVSLFVDGVSATESPVAASYAPGHGGYQLGANLGGSGYVSLDGQECAIGLNAEVDEIAIWASDVSLYAQDIAAFYPPWPDTQEIDWRGEGSITASEINARSISGTLTILKLDANSSITFDAALICSTLTVLAEGDLTLNASAGYQPTAADLAKLDLAGVTGRVYHGWYEQARVIAFNFNAWAGNSNNAGTSEANKLGANENANIPGFDIFGFGWNQNQDTINQTSPIDAFVYDSATRQLSTTEKASITWSAPTRHAWRNATDKVLRGYLDDSGQEANVCRATLTDIPFATYDAIVLCATDTGGRKFSPVTVNGTRYKWSTEENTTVLASSAADTWGAAQGLTVEYGRNALRIPNLVAKELTIAGGLNGNNARGGIAAILLVETAAEQYDTEVNAVTSVSEANALNRTEAIVNIHLSNGAIFTVDEEPNREYNLVCDGTLPRAIVLALDEETYVPTILPSYIQKLTFVDCEPALRLDSPHADLESLPITKIYRYKTTTIETSSWGNVYTKGIGTASDHKQIAHNGGWAELRSATESDVYYLAESINATASRVTITDAKVVYSDIFGVGMATYELKGATDVTTPRFILSQGGAGRTTNFLMQDTAKVTVTGTNNPDSNQSSIMFGHYNGPSTFTIKDNAEFLASGAQILVGKTSNNQTINLEGGTVDVKGIKLSASASGTNTINLNGGTLKLGELGISAYGSSTATINLGGLTTIEVAEAVTAPIAFPITTTDPDDLTHAIIKTGSGTLKLGSQRPRMDVRDGTVEFTVTVDELAQREIVLGVPENATAGSTDKVMIYDESGSRVNVTSVTVQEETHTVTLSLDVLPGITSATSVTALNLASTAEGVIVVVGAATCEAAYDITFDKALPTGVSLLVTGHVNLVGSGVTTFPATQILLDEGACVQIDKPLSGAFTVGANRTLIFKDTTIAQNLTVQAEANVKIRGAVSAAAAATITVNQTGVWTIERGATLTANKNNLFNNIGIHHIYGTLNLGTYNLEFNSYWAQCKYYFYAGSSITGTTGKFGQTGGYDPEIHILDDAAATDKFVTFDVVYEKLGAYASRSIFIFEGSETGLKFLKANNNNRMTLRAQNGAKIKGLELTGADANLESGDGVLLGEVTIGEGRTLYLQGNNAFGEGVILHLPATINAGSTTQSFNGTMTVAADALAEVPAFVTATSVIRKEGAGTLNILKARPVIDVVEGKVRIIATGEEILAGRLVLSIPENATPGDANKVEIFDDGGTQYALREAPIVDEDNHTVTLILAVNSAITTSGLTSELIAPQAEGRVLINGLDPANPIRIEIDEPFPAGVTDVLVSGAVELYVSLEGGVLPESVKFGDGATIILSQSQTLANTGANVNFIVTGGTLVVTGTAPASVRVDDDGSYDVKGVRDTSYPITLNGGTLTNTGAVIPLGNMQWWQVSLAKDSFIDTEVEFGTVARGHGQVTFGLNGHTLTKKGSGNYIMANVTQAGGGTIKIEGGTIQLVKGGRVPAGATLTFDVGADGALVVTEMELDKNSTGKVFYTGEGKVYLDGTATAVATVNLGNVEESAKDNTVHFVARTGTSKLKWTGDSATSAVTTSDSRTNPFVTVNAGATLNIDAHHYSGQLGAVRESGWIVNNGTLVFQDGGGIRYFREHLVLGPNAVVNVNSGTSPFVLYGGADKTMGAQLTLPSGMATIGAGVAGDNAKISVGRSSGNEYGEKGAAVDVGAGAKLSITCPIEGPDTLVKWGSGTLNIGSSREAKIAVEEGRLELVATIAELTAGRLSIPASSDAEEVDLTKYRIINAGGEEMAEVAASREDGRYVFTWAVKMARALTDFVDITVSETTVDYPVLLRLSEATLPGFKYDRAGSDGSKIRFYQLVDAADYDVADSARDVSRDAELPFEIVEWNPEGESLVWVKINPAKVNAKGKFRLYWHAIGELKSAPTTPDLSKLKYALDFNGADPATTLGSGEASNVTISGVPTIESGAFKANAGSIIVAEAGDSGLATCAKGFTMAFWVNPNGMANWQDVCGFKIGDMIYKFEKNSGNQFAMYSISESGPTHTANETTLIDFTANQWMHLALTTNDDGTGFKIYKNGTLLRDYLPGTDKNLWGTVQGAKPILEKFVIGVKGLANYSGTSWGGDDGRASSALVDEVKLYNTALTAAEIAPLAARQPTQALTTTFGLVNRPVNDDPSERMWVDYWTQEPALKHYWKANELSAEIVNASAATSALRSGRTIAAAVTTIAGAPANLPLADLGLYLVTYAAQSEALGPHGAVYAYFDGPRRFEVEVVESRADPEIDPMGATESGRVLLANDDSRQPATVTDQDYDSALWTHDDLTSTFTEAHLKPGRMHTLTSSEGRTLWRLNSVYLGNMLKATADDSLEIDPRFNALPWSTTASSKTSMILRNLEGASIESNIFTNGIGTIYFDAVNVSTNAPGSRLALVVEVTDAELDADPDETIWRRLEVTPIKITGATISGQGATLVKEAPTNRIECLNVSCSNVSTFDYYRFYAPVNDKKPLRFRIYRDSWRPSEAADREEDPDGWIAIDNVVASYAPVVPELEPAGRYDATRFGGAALGVETAFEGASYPTPNDSIRGHVYLTYGHAEDLGSVRLRYRWRYLNARFEPALTLEGAPVWKTAFFDLADKASGEYFTDALELPPYAGDLEYYYDITATVPFYDYVDYATATGVAAEPVMGYSEEPGRDKPIEIRAEKSLKPSGGTDWFVRLREWSSETRGYRLYVKDAAKADAPVKTVEMDFVGEGTWRGLIKSNESAGFGVGTIAYRLERDVPTNPGARAEDFAITTTYYRGNLDAESTPISLALIEGSSETWSTIANDDTTGYLMFQLDERTQSLTILRADYQNFNAWHDAHSDDAKFVGSSTDNGVKSGVSSKMRAYQESFKTWTDSMKTDELWSEDFSHLPSSAALEKPFAEARTRGERGWIAENGMWVAAKYKDADATGKALQLEGQGLGRLTASGYDIEPRGLESVTYKARLADAIDFNSVAWDYASLSSSGDSYTFATQVAMSDTFPGEAMTFDGAGTVSIFANYRPGRSAYEFRVMRTQQGRLQMQLYKWTSPTSAPELLYETGANVSDNYFRKEGTVGSPLYRTIYFSVSREADKSMRLQVGICKFGAAAGVNPETEFMGLTYWDKSNPLPMGAYGVAAANCAAKFDQPRSWDQPVVWQGAEDQKKVLNAPVVWPTSTPDYARSSLEDGRWAMDGERVAAFTDTTVAPTRWGIAMKPVEQQLFFEYLAPTVKGQPEPSWVALSTNVVSSYLTTAYEAFLYRPVHGSYRISHGGERSAPRVDIVLDDIVLNQWGGAEFGDFDTLEYVRGNANQGYPTNFVFTSGWVKDHKLELSAKRTLPGAPCSLRTPLMDGLEGRGLGLGVFTLGYRNADENLILHFQVATNNVAGSVKSETSSLDPDVWTTVRSVDFSKLSSDEREEGVLSLYLGCHGVSGVARVLVEPSLAEAAAAADDPKFGSIEIVSAFCRDEPVLDDKSWWGWNIRTFGLDNLTRWDTGSRSYLSDFATSESPDALGLSLALNNSATEDTRLETEAALYKLNAPFVQTPSFKVEGGSIGAITFRARMFALGDDDQKAEVRLYGTTSTEADAPAEAWELLDGGHFVISNSVYTTYAYRAKSEDTKYNAFRLAVTGVTEVNPGSRGPSPEEGETPVRVMLDEIVVSEAVFPKMGFKYVYPVRTNLESNEVSPVYLELEGRANFREQPLLGENWTIQAEIMTKRLPDEIDLTREPEVTFSWYEGRIPWGYGNWKNLAGAKTAKLARAEGEKMIYRGSFKVASDAVVDASEASQFAVVQYTARITYYNKAGEPLTAELESGEWVKPYWFDPIDYNKTTFSAFTILEAISPRCAWINEVNVYDGKVNGLYHLAATNQYVEVAFPAAQELKGWRLDYISNAVVTNTLAVFGSEGVPTEKLEPTEKDYAFMVLQSPKTRDAKTWENVTHDGVPVKIDGTWQNFDLNGGALDSEVPCALRLVRPSGIIEEAIVFEGTNKWVTGRYKDKYTIAKFVADRNAEGLADLNHFFGVGSEIENPLVTGLKGLSLGVVAGAGQTADEWSSEKHQTPGWVNEDQEIPDDWAILPAGSKIVITASVADDHIKQTFGDRVATTEAVKVTVPKGGEGTNITYQVDAWYEVDSLKTNKLELAALKGKTGTFTLTVGKGCSNSVAVVASTVVREDLRKTYGLDDQNDYTSAVMDWLDKGVNFFGEAFANPGEIKLAEYHDLNGVKLGDLSLTDMYWLDIDPTAGDWVLKGGVKNVGTKGKNFLITIKLELSNATEGLVYAPYILRGLTPGLTSVNHAEVGGNWNAATFKVTGDLQNGNENRAKWVPLRMFYFKPDATKANRSASFDENNEAVIEIWDPKDPNAGSQTAGWEKYPNASIFYKWAIDERNLPITTETLKPDSTF